MGAIIVGLAGIGVLGRMSLAQDTPQGPAVERYRITVVNDSEARNAYVFLLDTKTGRCWVRYTPSSKWEDATPPGLPAK